MNRNGISFDIYLHTYHVTKPYSNPRAEEMDLLLDNEEYKLLKPTFYKVDDKDAIESQINIQAYATKGDPWGNPYTFTNHILALWSLKQVTSMWTANAAKYTRVIYLRPDVLYRYPIDMEWLKSSEGIYIPDFQRISHNIHQLHAVNDRFAIGNPAAMMIYGNRFDEALEYSKVKQLHSETFLEDILQKHMIPVKMINYSFIRVRANGKTPLMDVIHSHYGSFAKGGGKRHRRRRNTRSRHTRRRHTRSRKRRV